LPGHLHEDWITADSRNVAEKTLYQKIDYIQINSRIMQVRKVVFRTVQISKYQQPCVVVLPHNKLTSHEAAKLNERTSDSHLEAQRMLTCFPSTMYFRDIATVL